MFELFAAGTADAQGPDDQASTVAKAKVWLRKAADKTGPALRKAASITVAGAKKAGSAGIALTKKVSGGVRNELAKRRSESAGADGETASAAVESHAAKEESTES